MKFAKTPSFSIVSMNVTRGFSAESICAVGGLRPPWKHGQTQSVDRQLVAHYLVTWNCTHIAGGKVKLILQVVNAGRGIPCEAGRKATIDLSSAGFF